MQTKKTKTSLRRSKTASAPRKSKSAGAKPSAGAKRYEPIRRELERQRKALLNEAGDSLSHRPEIEAYPDVSDQASAEIDQSFEIRLKERGQKLLKKIDEALERLASKTYGICERCEGEIPFERLRARPVTTLCIECKTLQEEEEKTRRW
jgi:DnaK suppressor protein